MTRQTLRISDEDNVVIALHDLAAGTLVEGMTLSTDVSLGHKIASRPISEGEMVVKFGYPIGVATLPIRICISPARKVFDAPSVTSAMRMRSIQP